MNAACDQSDFVLYYRTRILRNVFMMTDYLLKWAPDGLCLEKPGDTSRPLFIDFSSTRLNFRRENNSLRKEALIRAMGLKSHSTYRIVDATAGLGRDSFILASLGFQVCLIERSPVIHALLADGIRRGLQDEALQPIIERMTLIQADAKNWLEGLTEKPDIIYLDPMFPVRKKSALSKIEMRIFHEVVGDDPDADVLLQTALACARARVVVKRPRLAKPLLGRAPTYFLAGSSSRFDVYIT
ncbi:MAG TPA: class I SAM-dependent methyltransferase [Gammaproteobacteria bacterium]|nr:class I SAM-dependent methyltransferase [Gammaproteobacteria bacterium]